MKPEVNGDASEAPVLKCVELATGDVMSVRNRNKKVCKIPFYIRLTSTKIQENTDSIDGRYFVAMKGAPEPILDLGSTILIN